MDPPSPWSMSEGRTFLQSWCLSLLSHCRSAGGKMVSNTELYCCPPRTTTQWTQPRQKPGLTASTRWNNNPPGQMFVQSDDTLVQTLQRKRAQHFAQLRLSSVTRVAFRMKMTIFPFSSFIVAVRYLFFLYPNIQVFQKLMTENCDLLLVLWYRLDGSTAELSAWSTLHGFFRQPHYRRKVHFDRCARFSAPFSPFQKRRSGGLPLRDHPLWELFVSSPPFTRPVGLTRSGSWATTIRR